MPSEFQLIDEFLRQFPAITRPWVGPGDDCAVIPPSGDELCVTTDAVVDGVHFTSRYFQPEDVGHKALAVNLSDLAAMGAAPRWFVCAVAAPGHLTLPVLRGVARGMAKLARAAGVRLVGGNFTRAPALSLTITAAGEVPKGKAMLRSGGRPGDVLFVSGTLGEAALGLAELRRARPPSTRGAARRQLRPEPRLRLGQIARTFARAAIDVSDGFAQDLRHLCAASRVGARVWVEELPRSRAMSRLPRAVQQRLALAGGEDYELILAVPRERSRAFEAACRRAAERVTRVGELTGEEGLSFLADGGLLIDPPGGFDHFE